jgi:hypothetical protein
VRPNDFVRVFRANFNNIPTPGAILNILIGSLNGVFNGLEGLFGQLPPTPKAALKVLVKATRTPDPILVRHP